MVNKIDAKAFGLAAAFLWSGGVLLMGLTATVCGWAKPFVGVLSVMYVGYDATIIGSIIGGIWGFFDAFIGGYILIWLYNKLAK